MSVTLASADFATRRVALSGTYNVRDVGGYPTTDGRTVKWRTVLRGDALHRVDDAGRSLLTGYGLRTSLDLREADERTASPDQLHPDVRLVAVPLFSYQVQGEGSQPILTVDRSGASTLRETYLLLVRERGPALAAAIRELVAPGGLPVIVHCTAGKDRTGVIIALVLAAIGVSDEVIAADFAATGLFLNEEFRAAIFMQTAAAGLDGERLSNMLSCEPELILAALDEVRASHGDVVSYLCDNGMTSEEIDTLRILLLDDPARPEVNEAEPAGAASRTGATRGDV